MDTGITKWNKCSGKLSVAGNIYWGRRVKIQYFSISKKTDKCLKNMKDKNGNA